MGFTIELDGKWIRNDLAIERKLHADETLATITSQLEEYVEDFIDGKMEQVIEAFKS